MQSQNESSAQRPSLASLIVNFFKEHYGWVSSIIVVLSPLAGILNLLIYTNYIGRANVFRDSIELGPGLVLLWVIYILFFAFLIGSMSISSFVLAAGLRELQPKSEYTVPIFRNLIAIVAASMLTITIPIGLYAYAGKTAGIEWAIGAFLTPALASWFFISWGVGKFEPLTDEVKIRWRLTACAALTVWVGIIALLGIYPAWLVTTLYQGQGVKETFPGIVLFGFLAMIGSLAPAVGYYNRPRDVRFGHAKGALLGIALFLGILTLIVPSILSIPSIVAVKALGISDRQVYRYLVNNDDYPADGLDAKRWSITHSQEKKYLIKGFSLYTQGAVALICPADLAKVEISRIDRFSHQCIAFSKATVKQLDGVVADPEIRTDAAR